MGQNSFSVSDQRPAPGAIAAAFAQALALAADYRGSTSPNPPVGCVILDADAGVLAAAAHQRPGEDHAEALAIAQCRNNGTLHRIHTVVVTLEPCNHTGRTPPCTDAILATPASSVWIGAVDPNPSVRGGGATRLRAAGFSVDHIEALDHPDAFDLAAAAAALIGPFAKHVRTGLPWVTVKQALDSIGSMIPPAGRKTFTSPTSLELAHTLRRRADAILTGSGTVLADAPLFTVRRVPDFPGKRRKLVILDRRSRVPPAYLAAASSRGFDTLVAQALPGVLEELGRSGVLEVLVEAGPQLTRAILEDGLWDEHVIIRLGGDGAGGDTVDLRYLRQSPLHVRRDADVLGHH
jgi:diaminohydroxyphosphoribosylaminopyrimidine deaminase / 5-amino-6-(5-phosphoribosylamino)uracil reductase